MSTEPRPTPSLILQTYCLLQNKYLIYQMFYSLQKATKAGAVDRLTDTSKYTGSHKERFDESGKGKGLEGRKDFDEKADAGYVGGYKGKDTYDKTH